MNLKALARLSCKILALYAFLEAIIYLQNNTVPLVGYIQQRGWGDPFITTMIVSMLSAFILLVLAGCVVWAKADRLATRISGGEAERDPKSGVKPINPDLPTAAIAILGLFVITLALPQLGSFLLTIIAGFMGQGQIQVFTAIYQAIGILIKLGLGLWFFFGCHWFARAITKSKATMSSRAVK